MDKFNPLCFNIYQTILYLLFTTIIVSSSSNSFIRTYTYTPPLFVFTIFEDCINTVASEEVRGYS